MLSNNLLKFLIIFWLLPVILNVHEGLCNTHSSSTESETFVTANPKLTLNPLLIHSSPLSPFRNGREEKYDVEIIEENTAASIMERQEEAEAEEKEVEINDVAEEPGVDEGEIDVEDQTELADEVAADDVSDTQVQTNEEEENNVKEEENMERVDSKDIPIVDDESTGENAREVTEKVSPTEAPVANEITNNTTIFQKVDSCYTCNSNSNGNCSLYTHTTKVICKSDDAAVETSNKVNNQKHAGCFTMFDDNNNTTMRGCINELTEDGLRYCLTHKQYCAVCFSNNCNNVIAFNSIKNYQMDRMLFIIILALNIIQFS